MLPKLNSRIHKLWQWRVVLIAAPTIAVLVMAVNAIGGLQSLEFMFLDLFFCLRPKEEIDPRIVIVTIDEPDIKNIGQWPISDAKLSQVIETIKQQQPLAIGLDLYRDLPVEPGHQQLVKTFESTPNLIGVDKIIGDSVDPPPTLKTLDQVGISDMILDFDGKVRRVLMSHSDNQGQIRLSLGATIGLMYLESQDISLEMIDADKMHLGLGKALFIPLRSNDGGYVDVNAGGYQIVLNYRGDLDDFHTISMTDVLKNQIPADLIPGDENEHPLRDRIVLIGPIAPSLNDFFFTPYNSSLLGNSQPMPGVILHANLISQMISGALDARPLLRVWSNLSENVWILAWSFMGAILAWSFCPKTHQQQQRFHGQVIISLILGSSAVLASGYLAFLVSWWIPVIRPLLALIGSGLVIITYNNRELHIQNQKRLAQFLEAVPVGITVMDTTGKPYFINHKAKEILGPDRMPDRPEPNLTEMYQPYLADSNQIYPTEKLPIVRALQGESSTIDDLEIYRDGQRIPLEVWGTPIYDQLGNIAYAIVAFQDISERKKAEAERQAFTEKILRFNQAYERFIPKEFLNILNKESIIEIGLGEAVEKTMTTLFSDIRDFTTLSENLSPDENFQFINSYLSCMEPAINQNHGFIDKYIGDAIMALFPESADDAVQAGICMLKRLETYNQQQSAIAKPLKIGIGINTGSMMLGTVGGINRMDSTVISDAVNLGSRVETLTKNYGVSLLITQYTLLALVDPNHYDIRLIDRVKVKGKTKPVTVYEVFDADPPELYQGKLATKTDFEKAILLYHIGCYDEAKQLLEKCQKISPQDKTIQVYLDRLNLYESFQQ
jgi:adenylate cyclase